MAKRTKVFLLAGVIAASLVGCRTESPPEDIGIELVSAALERQPPPGGYVLTIVFERGDGGPVADLVVEELVANDAHGENVNEAIGESLDIGWTVDENRFYAGLQIFRDDAKRAGISLEGEWDVRVVLANKEGDVVFRGATKAPIVERR
jgi:hypothetical protein